MNNFKYRHIISEFKQYLDENLEDTVYFESLRIKYHHIDDGSLVYRNIIKEDNFITSRVLDENGSLFYKELIRSLRKVKKYETYTFSTIENLDKNSILSERLNSIQAISTICQLNKKGLFNEIHKECYKYPTSVNVSLKNFDLLFNNDPYESLSELLLLITQERQNENLYFNFIRYYLSNANIEELLSSNINETRDNKTAYIVAILYIFFIKEDKFYELTDISNLIRSSLKKISISIPKELNQKFNILDNIILKLEKIR